MDPGVNFSCFVLWWTTPASASLKPDKRFGFTLAPGLRCNSRRGRLPGSGRICPRRATPFADSADSDQAAQAPWLRHKPAREGVRHHPVLASRRVRERPPSAFRRSFGRERGFSPRQVAPQSPCIQPCPRRVQRPDAVRPEASVRSRQYFLHLPRRKCPHPCVCLRVVRAFGTVCGELASSGVDRGKNSASGHEEEAL